MKRNRYMVVLVFVIFFVISFLTNVLGPIIPDIISSFSLSLTLAALLPFSFFIAYGVMSIPAGMLVDRWREKPVMLASFALAFLGALVFSLVPRFGVVLGSLFSIGLGMAMLQVAINPLLRVAGGEEHFAFNSVMGQFIFGGASFLSPMVYTYFVVHLKGPADSPLLSILSRVVPPDYPWVALYWVFAFISLLMVSVLLATKFPRVERKEEERAGAWGTHRALFADKKVILFFFGIFAYVGTEQGVANWVSQFLATYHGVDTHTTGAAIVGRYWGMMTIGCILGLVLLKFFDSRRVLLGFASGAILFLSAGLFGSKDIALVAFPMMGFAASVMWSIIFSLALNSVAKHHGSFSGILCTGIIGGAVLPLVVGWLGDHFGLRTGMCVLYLTLGYIFSIGFWAKPLITNQTTSLRRRNARVQQRAT